MWQLPGRCRAQEPVPFTKSRYTCVSVHVKPIYKRRASSHTREPARDAAAASQRRVSAPRPGHPHLRPADWCRTLATSTPRRRRNHAVGRQVQAHQPGEAGLPQAPRGKTCSHRTWSAHVPSSCGCARCRHSAYAQQQPACAPALAVDCTSSAWPHPPPATRNVRLLPRPPTPTPGQSR